MKHEILIIEDDAPIRELLKEILEADYSVTSVNSGEDAIEALNKGNYALVITDLKLPGIDGIDIIKRLKKLSPETVSIVLTGYGTVESAVEAMRSGAYTYLQKPFRKDDLLMNVKRALEYYELKRENFNLREEIQKKYSFENIIGKSKAMLEIFEMIKMVADTDSSILLLGESGTGKELIAKAIHYNSSRRHFPFVPVNCGAIPGELLESELFGYERGAFTGAVASRQGRFERAHKGTIFLDEIGEMALHLQVKLLRVLQEKEFERVGGNKTIEVDVRIIAATNKDIEEAVEKKAFRKDLYYRLNVIPIHIPPLRERKEDIPLLVDHFLNATTLRKKKKIDGIADETMDILINYPWPGNIRELENIIERVVILKQDSGPITPEDLPMNMRRFKDATPLSLDIPKGRINLAEIPKGGINLAKIVEELEREFIEKALHRAGGVKSRAAELLGINRTTLIEKMKKRGMLLPKTKANN